MASIISQDLRDTVEANPHIQEVHFTKKGEHFFNAHEFADKKGGGKGKGKIYGRLGVEAVHVRNEGDRKIFKNDFVALPEFEIVETLSRDEILAAKVKGEAKPVSEVEAENAKLKAELEKLKAEAAKK